MIFKHLMREPSVNPQRGAEESGRKLERAKLLEKSLFAAQLEMGIYMNKIFPKKVKWKKCENWKSLSPRDTHPIPIPFHWSCSSTYIYMLCYSTTLLHPSKMVFLSLSSFFNFLGKFRFRGPARGFPLEKRRHWCFLTCLTVNYQFHISPRETSSCC